MKSILKRALLKLRRHTLRHFASTPKGREQLEWHIFNELEYLGVGSGVEVDASGERLLLQVLQENAPTDRPLCIFDVGANQGQFLQMIRKGIGALPYHIHSFEPSAATFEILKGNVGDSSNASLNNVGLGKAPGEFELFTDAVGSGMASLYNRRLDHFGRKLDKTEKIRLTTLDQYCDEHAIQQIDLLKMDVEGHELDVLTGSARMFSQKRIRSVTFEFGGTNIDSRTFFQDFYYFFKGQGMKSLHRILPSGQAQQIHHYRESLEQFVTTNFLVMMQ